MNDEIVEGFFTGDIIIKKPWLVFHGFSFSNGFYQIIKTIKKIGQSMLTK